jgi:uncharacterized delta-60 repeat protein
LKSVKKLVAVLAVVWVSVLCLQVSGAAAKPGLERSFGDNGIVDLVTALPGYAYADALEAAGAPNGESFVLYSAHPCAHGGCTPDLVLQRFLADGQRDLSFGGSPAGVRIALGPNSAFRVPVAVDPEGRPVIALGREGGVSVIRLTAEGVPDPTFGSSGRVDLACDCTSDLRGIAFTRSGRIVVEGQRQILSGPDPDSAVVLVRLLPNGALDKGFGRDGAITMWFTGVYAPLAMGRLPSGPTYVAGLGCCDPQRAFAARISSSGRADTHFRKVATRAIQSRMPALSRERWLGSGSLVVQSNGRVDVFYGLSGHGIVFRLLPSGQLDRSFGRGGARGLPWGVNSAVLDSGGGTTGLVEGEGGVTIVHLLAGDRPDPRFRGGNGITIARTAGDSGFKVESLADERGLIFGRGQHGCRGDCGPTPKLMLVRLGGGKPHPPR